MRFLTIGLGHCGGKIASTFKRTAMDEKHLIVDVCGINTDRADLKSHKSIPEKNKLLLGSGKGAARDWREGYDAGVDGRDHIRNLLKKLLLHDTDIVMLTLGEGGGSGSGLAPIVAEVLGEFGRECIALTTLPFQVESVKSKVNAAKGLDLLYRQDALKSLICLDNDKIVAHYPDSVLTDAYEEVNKTAIQTFLNLLDLAHTPGQADRIDESELSSIFSYPGFATLANYRTYANMVSDLDSMLQHSWEGSLFADVNPTTAAGVLLGVYGPNHLFTTTQVDNVRRVLKNMLVGRDTMLGVYPIDRCRWVSYVGIMTGLDIPQKVNRLLETASEEHNRQEEILRERRSQKSKGLGFQLSDDKTERTVEPQRAKKEGYLDLEKVGSSVINRNRDISSTLREVMDLVEGMNKKEMTNKELLDYIKLYIDEDESTIAACLMRLKEMGCIIEPRRGVLQVL